MRYDGNDGLEGIPFETSERTVCAGTRLFGLEPLGGNTFERESLRGYLVRLAVDHRVRPRELVQHVLGDLDPRIVRWSYAKFFSSNALSVDGLGVYAQVFSDALNLATGRKDLAKLSFLPWKDLISSNGQPVLARVRRWCPDCLREGVASGTGPFWQLRWSMSAVVSCPKHGHSLLASCVSCGARQPAIPRQPSLWHCDVCESPLTCRPDAAADVEAAARRCAAQMEQQDNVDALIGVQGALARSAWDSWMELLEAAVRSLGEGKRSRLCAKLGFQPRALNAWMTGRDRASLPLVSRLCAALGLSAAEVFTGQCALPVRVQGQRPGGPLIRHPAEVRQTAKRLLQLASIDAAPPSLRRVATDAGVSRAFLKYWFPGLALTVTSTRKRQAARLRTFKRQEALRLVDALVDAAVKQGRFPARKLIEQAAREAGHTLIEPALLDQYHAAMRRHGLSD